jgi:hypothetical protein
MRFAQNVTSNLIIGTPAVIYVKSKLKHLKVTYAWFAILHTAFNVFKIRKSNKYKDEVSVS